MKKAIEMKNATIAVKEAQETAIRELAERYAESVVMAEIEKASAEGFFKTPAIRKDSGINYHYLRHYIESFDYKVEGKTNEYTIYW